MSSPSHDALVDLGEHIYMGDVDAVMAWMETHDPDAGYIIAWAAGAAAEFIKDTEPPCEAHPTGHPSPGQHFYGFEAVDSEGHHRPPELYMQLVACALNDDPETTVALMSTLSEESATETALKLFGFLRQAMIAAVAHEEDM